MPSGDRGGGAARMGMLGAAPLADIQGTVLVLGTAAGSLTLPTTPRPIGAILMPDITTEEFMLIRLNAPSTDAFPAEMPSGSEWSIRFNSSVTTINARVASGLGTLHVSYLFGGTVGG